MDVVVDLVRRVLLVQQDRLLHHIRIVLLLLKVILLRIDHDNIGILRISSIDTPKLIRRLQGSPGERHSDLEDDKERRDKTPEKDGVAQVACNILESRAVKG